MHDLEVLIQCISNVFVYYAEKSEVFNQYIVKLLKLADEELVDVCKGLHQVIKEFIRDALPYFGPLWLFGRLPKSQLKFFLLSLTFNTPFF